MSYRNRVDVYEVFDVRFPTSTTLLGSDAMNPDPDYSAAYLRMATSDGDVGNGLVFTIGRGNDVQCAAIEALRPLLVDFDVDRLECDPGSLARHLLADSQFRWLGPEKGVMHMAIGAVVNAGWDLLARRANLPLWKLLATMPAAALLTSVDFRYISDALTYDEALDILTARLDGRDDRIDELDRVGYPAYTTAPGWLGYSDELLVQLATEAVADGFRQIKLKVGSNLNDDVRRVRRARLAVGPDIGIALDANQRWGVAEAIAWTNALSDFDVAWIEEPTSPDDLVGHAAIARGVAPIAVATGEHCHNPIMFKQLLQLEGADVIQIDATRVGGVGELIATLLLAEKFGKRVCPHAGGVGLCEMVQHLSFFDYAAVSASMDGRMIEWVDSLHDNFLAPASVVNGRYLAPVHAGFSTEMHGSSIADYLYSAATTSGTGARSVATP